MCNENSLQNDIDELLMQEIIKNKKIKYKNLQIEINYDNKVKLEDLVEEFLKINEIS